MPRIGWSLEQRAVVKRYMAITTFFAVAGLLFSIFLIASGNSGGWTFLAIIALPYVGVLLFLKNMRREQPGRG